MSDIITQSEEQTHIDDASQASNKDKMQQIIDLLTGSGKKDFEELEKHLSFFCPFEAIGMVRQEIRHAHFLCYLLDPNQTHPFGDLFIKSLLFQVLAQLDGVQVPFSLIDLHLMSATKSIVFRERWNIDILIEIPSTSFDHLEKDLVIVIELKIGARESSHQLSKYHERIMEEYPTEKWEHCFIFLTPDGIDPSEKNKDIWAPVSLIKVIQNFDHTVDDMSFNGKAVDLYRDYSLMLRRNFLKDEELSKIAKRLWAKHRKALETLYYYWPDLQVEILDCIRRNPSYLVDHVEKKAGFKLSVETHEAYILRFVVDDWKKIEGFCDGSSEWVKSAALVVIELTDWGDGSLRGSIVLGPGEQTVREAIYKRVLLSVDEGNIKIDQRTATPQGSCTHLSSREIQRKDAYKKAEEDETSAEEMAEKALEKMSAFLIKNLPAYDTIIREALATD